jgi:hypothetical protein
MSTRTLGVIVDQDPGNTPPPLWKAKPRNQPKPCTGAFAGESDSTPPGSGKGRGGRRPGAGRKATGRSTVPVTVRISVAEHALLVELAEKQGIGVSEWGRRQIVNGGRGLKATRAKRKQ